MKVVATYPSLSWKAVSLGDKKGAVSLPRSRLGIVMGGVAFLFFLLIYRLTVVMLGPEGEEAVTYGKTMTTHASRGKIIDRNGEILAVNLATGSVFANPQEIIDPHESAQKLAALFPDLDAGQLEKKFSDRKSFLWVKRNLTPKQQQKVHTLGLPGIYFQKEEKRFYPYGPSTGHVVGFTNIDLEGAGGLERQYDKQLLESDAPLQLALDIRIQNILRQSLQRAIETFRAKGGNGIVMDIRTGEILAMVSMPDFDPQQPTQAPEKNRFNANTLGSYELGSVFKIFTFAMALDSGKVTLNDGFDTSSDIRVGRFRITDYKGKKRYLTMPEIFMYSSNLGTIKAMQAAGGKDVLLAFFDKIGFLKKAPVDYPELSVPLRPKEWKELNAMNATHGYSIAVSPLHVITALAAMVNGGILFKPTFLKQGAKVEGVRVIAERTSDKVRRLMHLGAKQGTARKADVVGYVVGGKTGSANKKIKGGYSKKDHLASVAAAFPMHAPRFVILVTLDAPQPTKETFGYATAGWTAAPVARDVIRGMGPLMNILPVDEESTEIQEAMYIKVNQNETHRAVG